MQPAVTQERIEAALTQLDLKYAIDDNDNEIGIAFENCMCWLNLGENILRGYSIWRGKLEMDKLDDFVALTNEINCQTVVPKAYINFKNDESGSGAMLVLEHSAWIEKGLSDEQLLMFLQVFFRSVLQILDEKVEADYPDLITWTEEA